MRSRTSYQKGIWAEWYARMFLRAHGYRIEKSRHVTGRNTHRAEIDIIARRGKTIAFVEVKNRKNIDCAWDAITPAQAVRLRRAAETYLMKRQWDGDARFDVIAVCGWKIYWAKNSI